MKRIVIEVDDVVARNWKMSCQEVRDRVTKIVARELKYPKGYARPDEKEAWERYQRNLARLPETILNMKRSQEEAARNGLTEEILEKLLVEADD